MCRKTPQGPAQRIRVSQSLKLGVECPKGVETSNGITKTWILPFLFGINMKHAVHMVAIF